MFADPRREVRYRLRYGAPSTTLPVASSFGGRGGPLTPPRNGDRPKDPMRLPDLDQAKSADLNSVSSRDAQRGYPVRGNRSTDLQYAGRIGLGDG